LTIRIRGATDGVKLLNPRPLEMTFIPVIMRVRILNSNPGRSGISEWRRLSFNVIPLIVIRDEGGVFSGLMIGGREHFVGTRDELVERR
jgi:hypothetical protein